MGLRIGMVTVDCADAQRLASFWAAALHVSTEAEVDGWVILAPTDEGAPAVGFQQVPEASAGKNRLHLDLLTDDRPGEVARLIELGATHVDEQSLPGMRWTVLADPEGNRFCVATHDR